MPQTKDKTSYCLDIRVGRDDECWELLIGFLRLTGTLWGVTATQCGRMNGVKILRVLTPKAHDLMRHIVENFHAGDGNEYTVHDTCADAEQSTGWLPDLNHPLGDEEFDLLSTSEAIKH